MQKYLFYIALAIFIASASHSFSNQKNTLTVYTYSSFNSEWGPGPKIKEKFESKCNCTLKFIDLDDGVSLLTRLKIEKGRSKADIILGLDLNLLEEAKQTNLFSQHHVDLSSLTLPFKWIDTIFIPFDYSYFAFIYNKKKNTPPNNFHDFIKQAEKNSIIFQDPRTSTPGLGLLLWIKAVFKDQSPKIWHELSKKTLTVTKSWSESYGLFLKGEADYVLSYITSPAYHQIIEKNNQYMAAHFNEGHYIHIETAALLKKEAINPLALDFMSFITSKDFQEEIPTGNWMFPVIDLKAKLPSEFNKIKKPKTLNINSYEISKKRKIWINEWLNSFKR